MNRKLYILLSGWTLLGLKRGLDQYDYNYNRKITSDPNKLNTYLYTNKIADGLMGVIIYINPIFIFITLPKELYRLEVNIRGLENEKKGYRYNDLL